MSVWLVLVVRLPSQPSSRRVRAWRRLRTLGAVALKNSVWVLPCSPESYEQLQWLDQEVQRDKNWMPYEILEGEHGGVQVRMGEKNHTPEEISAFILAKLREHDWNVSETTRVSGFRTGAVQRNQNDGRQNTDNGDNDQKFDEGKALSFGQFLNCFHYFVSPPFEAVWIFIQCG